jgi:hypothetical protein
MASAWWQLILMIRFGYLIIYFSSSAKAPAHKAG